MADIALTTANRVEIVGFPKTQKTLACGADLTAGAPVQESTTGKWQAADATTAAKARNCYVLTRTGKSGESVTGVREGRLDGFAITGLAFNAPVYLSDTGTIADAAGTVSTVLGFVEAVTGQPITSGHDKILRLQPPGL
jgi:hypothetical protein